MTFGRKFFLLSFAVASVACVVCPAPTVRAAEPDGPSARDTLAKTARSAFLSGDYSQLEKTADDLRRTKARFPEGVWKLPSFYDGLKPKYGNNSHPDWEGWFAKLDAWKAAFPDSPTQMVARAEVLVNYAWDARGGGYGNTVTAEGWKLLAERLAQARQVLEEAEKLPVRDPQLYLTMQTVALGESWDHDRYEALFDKAVKAEPTYYHYYFSRTTAELPRWGGGPDSWIDFAEKAARDYDPEEGLAIYTRVFWSHAGAVGGDFKNPRIDWKKVRQGFRDIEKKYPDSNWNLNNFCRFACLADDRETAHELFGRLGDAVSIPAWGSRTAFEGWRRWSDPVQAPSPLRADLVVPSDEKLLVASLAFSPDGKTLLAGYEDGEIRLWDLETRKIAWHKGLNHGQVSAITFSPDGKTFAVGTGSVSQLDTPGGIAILDAATRKVLATDESRRGNVFGLAFTPDGKTLVVVGGCLTSFSGKKAYGEAALYDIAGKKIEPLPWGELGSPLRSVAVSRDGQFLVTPNGRSMNCWNLTKHEFVNDYHTRGMQAKYVEAVLISPDGKTLVTGTAPFWNNPTANGELRRWDMTAPGWPEIKAPAWAPRPGGVLAAVFSPDGKWLAAGGYDGSVQLWDTTTGKVTSTLIGHHDKIGSLAFAPDGKTLVSGAADGTVKWWDVPVAAASEVATSAP